MPPGPQQPSSQQPSSQKPGVFLPVLAARLAARLAPGLGESVAERLLLSPRLGERVRAWATAGAADALAALDERDRTLAAAGEGALRQAAVLAGSVWHARRIRSLVLARDLQAFIEAHGPGARTIALQHLSLSPAPAVTSAEPLADAVLADGRACVSAWLGSLPGPAADALRLSPAA